MYACVIYNLYYIGLQVFSTTSYTSVCNLALKKLDETKTKVKSLVNELKNGVTANGGWSYIAT